MATTTKTYSVAGANTWVAPPGVSSVAVEGWGGGGAGANRTTAGQGGGGAGGAYAKVNAFVPTAGTTYNMVVGAGGNSNNASNGVDTTFNSTTMVAKGGNSVALNTATGATPHADTNSTGDVRYAGGAGVTGNATIWGGGGGSSGGTGAGGRAGQGNTGGGNGSDSANLPTGAGAGGNGGKTNGSVGTDGVAPGGGGGGAARAASTNRKGGNGAVGKIVLTYTTPLISALVDNFDDNSFDQAKWDRTTTQIAEANGEIEITTTLAAQYDTMSSDHVYDLTGSEAFIQVIDATGGALTSYDSTPLGLVLDGNNSVSWVIYGGQIRAYSNIAGGGNTERAAYDYNENAPIWLRIRESGGTVYWDYSTDAVAWTNLYSATVASLFAITALTVNIVAGHWNTEVTTTVVKFDNFNYFPGRIPRMGFIDHMNPGIA